MHWPLPGLPVEDDGLGRASGPSVVVMQCLEHLQSRLPLRSQGTEGKVVDVRGALALGIETFLRSLTCSRFVGSNQACSVKWGDKQQG